MRAQASPEAGRVAVIYRGGPCPEAMALHADGCISRPAIGMQPSGKWRVVGAVERNNFGRVVNRYTLGDILADPYAIPWQFKNGKQRVFIQDFDHGAHREWGGGHRVGL